MVKECTICTNSFDFCPTCSTQKGSYKARGFCSTACYEISSILQRYGSNVMTAEDTVFALDEHGIDTKKLQPKIEEYYSKIVKKFNAQKKSMARMKPVVEVIPTVEDVEVVIEDNKDTTTSENEE